MNRRERVAGTGRNEGIVAFKAVQMWLGYLNQSPGQISLLYIFHCDHPKAWCFPSCEGRMGTSSHGQTTREVPSFVLTCMSTVPTSVTVPTCDPSRTLSPIWNLIFPPLCT